MPTAITPARRLAIVALARISGAAAAAKTGRVDVRTVRRWLEEEADIQHDEQEWAAARAAAQERHLTALLTGEVRGIAGWATSAGVSARNQRYARVIAQRDARQAESEEAAKPEPDPVREALAAVPDDRQRWLRDYLLLLLDRHRYVVHDGEPCGTGTEECWGTASADEEEEATGEAETIAWYRWVASAEQSELEAATEAVMAQIREAVTGYTVSRHREYNQWWYRVVRPDGSVASDGSNFLRPEFKHLPILDEGPRRTMRGTSRLARPRPLPALAERPRPLQRPSQPLVVDADWEDHDRGWHPYYRESWGG